MPHAASGHSDRRIPAEWKQGQVSGVIWVPLKRYSDARGWLVELFRVDDLPEEYRPVMAYVSQTGPMIVRGPHEHLDQADYFCFLGPSDFKLYLWDIRVSSATYGKREVAIVGESNPMAVIVPAGVVHAYRNVGGTNGMVFNAANRLYKGWGKREPVDEIRHEDESSGSFVID